MSRRIEIEALDLEMKFLAKEESFTRRFGLFSEPEFMLKDGGTFRHDAQIELKNEESDCIISNIVADLTDGILPSTENDISERISILSSGRVKDYVENAVMQACDGIDFHKIKMGTGSIRNSSANDKAKDHLVPKDAFTWEDEQESIDGLWNEMSSGRSDGTKFKDGVQSDNLAAQTPYNESKEFNFMPSPPTSQMELKESDDLFSQIYQQNFQLKKENIILSRKANPLLGKQYVPANSKPNPFDRIAEIAFGTCPTDKLDENEGKNYLKVFDTQTSMSKDSCYSQNGEQDQFENITNVAGVDSPATKCEIMGEIDDESCTARPSMSPVISYARNVEQDEIESDTEIAFAKSPTEMSDIYDEEINAAIERYVNSQKQTMELGYLCSCKSVAQTRELESAKLCATKSDVGTQTIIKGSIYSSSSKCDCVEKCSTLKRSLKALCLENLFCKKPKTFLSSSPSDCLMRWQTVNEIKELKEFSSEENSLDSPRSVDDLKTSGKMCTNTIKNASQVEEEQSETHDLVNDKEMYTKNDKMKHGNNLDDTEPQDHEVPRSVVVGTLPNLSPAKFFWEKDGQTPVGNITDSNRNSDSPSKSKTPRRLRLGLSKRFKPQLALHQIL